MARLNDPPAPAAESVDALKRRFIRQNREIARVNSNQSIRIRNLEAEISRLLAENIAIREDAIAAKIEAEKYASSKRLERELLYIKEKFEAKLTEVNALVGDLGKLPERVARRSSVRKRKSGATNDVTRSPPNLDWKNRQTASGIDRDVQEARMPPIVEDKYYPRRTLEVNELKAVTDDMEQELLESPDLGPPPVVHFEDSEPFSYDFSHTQSKNSDEISTTNQEALSLATINLETRRKRRTSSLLQDMSNLTEERSSESNASANDPQKRPYEASATSTMPPQQPIKTSMKRKLDLSELEDTSGKSNRDLDDFIFQRRPSMSKPTVKSSRFTRSTPNLVQTNPNDISDLSPAGKPPVRKILAPKSTNSPSKRRIGTSGEKDLKDKDDSKDMVKSTKAKLQIELGSNKESKPQIPSQVVENVHGSEQIIADSLPPKTPAAELAGFLSPSSVPTEPSTKQKSMQEMAITNSVEDVLNGSIGRGSRRARAAVSYVEPNLRDKMRRPGKELVGAVEGLAKSKSTDRTSLVGLDEGLSLDGRRDTIGMPSTSKTIHAINEDVHPRNNSDARVKPPTEEEAPSPLRGKVASVARETDVRTRGQGSVVKPSSRDRDISGAISQLAIFDPPSSSPIAEEKSSKNIHSTASSGRPLSRSRRHSTHTQASQALIGLERPNSAASTRSSNANKESSSRRSVSVTSLPPVGSLKTAPNTKKPVERTASNTALTRRKSMMI